jgi:hypothetical protein
MIHAGYDEPSGWRDEGLCPTVHRLEAQKEALVQERFTTFEEAMVHFNHHLGRIYRYMHGMG